MSVFYINNKSNLAVELNKNNNNGDVNMAISNLYDLIEETIDRELDKFENTFFEVFDDETTSNGRIYINTNIDEDDVLPIVKRILKQFPMVKVTIEDTPSVVLGYYFYGFTISIIEMSETEIMAIEDFEESLNNIEYLAICKKEVEEEIIMDNSIIDNYYENGEEHLVVEFEDEIEKELGGDWYCRASGGAFSSESDYWNYILG